MGKLLCNAPLVLALTFSALLLPAVTVVATTSTATGSENTFERTYGGTENDYANSIQQTSDGGYVVAGTTNSFGAGSYDSWVLKLDSDGGISSACAFGVSSSVTPAATTVTPTATTVTATTSTATVSSTSVTGTPATGLKLGVNC